MYVEMYDFSPVYLGKAEFKNSPPCICRAVKNPDLFPEEFYKAFAEQLADFHFDAVLITIYDKELIPCYLKHMTIEEVTV